MTTCRAADRPEHGFTLVEVIVVLAVLGTLVGTALPLAGAFVDANRREDVRSELAEIATALERHYYDRAAFPSTLDATGFYGVYLQPGVSGTTIEDSWGESAQYLYSVDSGANTASVWSRGENGTNEGVLNEDYTAVVYGAAPGLDRTRERMRIIIEVLATFLEGGGTLTGTWPVDRAAMGLGTQYAADGFGTAFTLDAATFVLRSAGPDRSLNTSDDLTS